MHPIRVAIAEPDYMIREFLMTVLIAQPEVELVAVCCNREELQTAILTWAPGVVVTDIRVPSRGTIPGVSVGILLRGAHPEVGLVILSQYAEPAFAIPLLDEGAGGLAYLLKESICHKADLIAAIEAVACGESVIDTTIVDVLISAQSRSENSRVSELDSRERELLADIASGKSNRAIARSLVLTRHAVEARVTSIFSKLGLPDTHDVSRRVKATLIFLSGDGLAAPSRCASPPAT